jgi:hypothetical protein
MIITTHPVDSAEAAELRERAEVENEQLEAMQAQRVQRQRDHDQRCRRGWLGEDNDGRPVPCLQCRPWLVAGPCLMCSTPPHACSEQQEHGRGRCCTDCDHHRGGR